MTPGKRTRTKALGVLFAGLLSCALSPALLQPETALADPISELQQIQEQIQQNNADYEAATEQVNKLQEQIDDNEDRIAQIEAELPAAQERAANSMRTLYKMQQSSGGLVARAAWSTCCSPPTTSTTCSPPSSTSTSSRSTARVPSTSSSPSRASWS